ncbi:MAG: ATP-grasp domain-containing protein [Nitrospinaceae bacterium]
MKKTNLLLLAPHWRVSLVRAFQNTKTKLVSPGKVVGADSDPLSPSSQVLDAAHTIPPFPDPACLGEVLEICRKESIHSLIPLTNKAVEFLNLRRDHFKGNSLLHFLPGPEVIDICHDKLKLAGFLQARGILSPPTSRAKSFEGELEFPLIAKPRWGEGGKNSFIIENPRDLEFYAQKCPDHVIQPLIQGREFTIDWFSNREGKPLLIVPRERLAVRGGEVAVSRIRLDPQLIEAAQIAGTRLGLRGPCNLQGILDPAGRFFFTDVNLRFGSGSVHTIAAGGDIPAMILQELAGTASKTFQNSIRDGSIMTRFHDAFFLST